MKKLFVIALCVVLILCVSACSGKSEEKPPEEEISSTTPTETVAMEAVEGSDELSALFNQAVPCALGTYVDTDVVSIRLDRAYTTYSIDPEDTTSGSYTYIKGEDGRKYLVIAGEMKNNTDHKIDLQTFDVGSFYDYIAMLHYDNKYYLCRMCTCIEGDNNIDRSIEAGATAKVYIFYSFPDEELAADSVEVLLGFDNFEDTIYNGLSVDKLDQDKCVHLYKFDFSTIDHMS